MVYMYISIDGYIYICIYIYTHITSSNTVWVCPEKGVYYKNTLFYGRIAGFLKFSGHHWSQGISGVPKVAEHVLSEPEPQ